MSTEIDTKKIGIAAAEMMEKINAPDQYPEGSEIVDVLILVEMKVPLEDGAETQMDWYCTEERRVVQVGMLHMALRLFDAEPYLDIENEEGPNDD